MPQTLDYLRISPDDRPQIVVSAAISIACGIAALLFMLSLCAGVWQRFVPVVAHNAGWIAGGLALSAVINGGIGALKSPRESGWYNAALIGYAAGMFVGTLSPVFFML
jgi:hypothetical protein